MSDINLSVGLHTGNAKKDADNLVRSLDDIISRGKLLTETNRSIRVSTDRVSSGFKFATVFMDKYGDSIRKLAGTGGVFTTNAASMRDVLESTVSSFSRAAQAISTYERSLGGLGNASSRASAQANSHRDAVAAAANAAANSGASQRALSDSLGRLTSKYAPLNTAITNAAKALKALEKAERAGKISSDTLAEARRGVAKAIETANSALSGGASASRAAVSETERLVKSYDGMHNKIRQLRADLIALNTAEVKATMTRQQHARITAEAKSRFESASAAAKRSTSDTAALAASVNRLASSYSPAITRSEQLNRDIQQLSRAVASGAGNVEHYRRALANAQRELSSLSPTLTRTQRALQAFSGGIRAADRGLIGASRSAGALNPILSDQVGFFRFAGRAAALYISSLVTSKLLDTNLSLMALNESLKAIAGSSTSAARSMEMLTNTADQLGYTTLELGKGYKLISASARGTALEGEAIDAIFKSVTSSSRALGLSAADTEGSLRA